MSVDVVLRFAGCDLAVHILEEAREAVVTVLDFVQPHFTVKTAKTTRAASPYVEILPLDAWGEPAGEGVPTRIHRARREAGHVWGTRWQDSGRTRLFVPSSGTAFDLADDASDARIFVTGASQYHVSDFLRDVFWELAASTGAGTFVHAAAVSDGRGVVIFVGPKSTGKTTTALDFLHADAEFYSGDVLFMESAGLSVHSFPDYPGVCWGTLRTYPRLFEMAVALGFTPSEDNDHKILLPHDFYGQALGAYKTAPPLPLRAVVRTEIAAEGPARISATHPVWDHFEPMQRKNLDPGEGWQPFIDAVAHRWRRTAVGGVGPRVENVRPETPWYLREGWGRLRREEILKVLRAEK